MTRRCVLPECGARVFGNKCAEDHEQPQSRAVVVDGRIDAPLDQHTIEEDQLTHGLTVSKWDVRFLRLAQHIASWSKDPSTQVGCVIVGDSREIRSTGFNGFPRGVRDLPARYADRALKYALICHAEENAIMHAARNGVSVHGCIAYTTWPSCSRCVRSLIQAGIREVVYPQCEIPECEPGRFDWREDFELGETMLDEAMVLVRTIKLDNEDDPHT